MSVPRRRHAVIFSLPSRGHAVPLLSISIKLAASSPDVTFSFFCTQQTNRSLSPIVDAMGLPNLKIHDVWDGVPTDYASGVDNLDLAAQLILNAETFLKAMPGNFYEAMAPVVKEEGEISCLITDLFIWPARQMAEEKGVPWVAYWACSPGSLAALFHSELIRRTIGTGPEAVKRMDDPLDFIPSLSNLRVRDLPQGTLFGPFELSFVVHLYQAASESQRAEAVIFNAFNSMDHAIFAHLKIERLSCLAVGPLTLVSPLPPAPDPHACITWLNLLKHNPSSVVYVSFGSEALPPPAELAALAEGLEASGSYFLWSLKEKASESLPAGFLDRTKERGVVVPWAPQLAVLEHVAVGAHMTHCGWNSVTESIVRGVPMICRPLWADNMVNCRLITHVWRIGVEVDGGTLTKDGVVRSIERVLKTDEGKEMRQNAKNLEERAMDAVNDGGSSSQDFSQLVRIVSGQ